MSYPEVARRNAGELAPTGVKLAGPPSPDREKERERVRAIDRQREGEGGGEK